MTLGPEVTSLVCTNTCTSGHMKGFSSRHTCRLTCLERYSTSRAWSNFAAQCSGVMSAESRRFSTVHFSLGWNTEREHGARRESTHRQTGSQSAQTVSWNGQPRQTVMSDNRGTDWGGSNMGQNCSNYQRSRCALDCIGEKSNRYLLCSQS